MSSYEAPMPPNPNQDPSESNPEGSLVFSGFRQLILRARISMTDQVMDSIQRSDQVITENAQRHVEERGFSSSAEEDDPNILALPETPLDYVSSYHRDRQVRSARAGGRGRWRVAQVYGSKDTGHLTDPSSIRREDYRTTDQYRAAVNQAKVNKKDIAVTFDRGDAPPVSGGIGRKTRAEIAKISDARNEAKMEKIWGTPEYNADGSFARVNGEIVGLGGKLGKGRDGMTKHASLRRKAYESLERKKSRLQERLDRHTSGN